MHLHMHIRVAVNDHRCVCVCVCVCVCLVYLWVVLEQILSLQEPNVVMKMQQAMNHNTYQIVHRIFWFSLTDLNKTLSDSWHHMTHQVVT